MDTKMFLPPLSKQIQYRNTNSAILSNLDKNDRSIKKEYSSGGKYFFSNLKSTLIRDLNETNLANESVIYKKYPKKSVIRWLESPQRYEKQLRELSGYLYLMSSHYKRLIDHYASLILFNYIVIPTKVNQKVNSQKFKEEYLRIVSECNKYCFRQECKKILKTTLRDGIFYGLCYESEDTFYILNFDSRYARISHVEDGCLLFSIDLTYFTQRESNLSEYGEEITIAYKRWKNNKKASSKWFRPSNGICIKADETNLLYSLPVFSGLLLSIYDIEEYKMLQKAKTENDNYKVLAMKMDTDDDGVPKMSKEMMEEYYYQAANNIAENIGLIVSPWSISEFSFQNNASSDKNAVVDAENEFWYSSGTSPLLFGSAKATTSSSLELSIKPDEQVAMTIVQQIERFFNRKIKKMDLEYSFKLTFLNQSIFNEKQVIENYQKAATYGVAGAKLGYASALGFSPDDVIGLSYLEDDILKVGTEIFTRPLISSNTLSNGEVETSGRPTAEEAGVTLGDAGEKSRDRK